MAEMERDFGIFQPAQNQGLYRHQARSRPGAVVFQWLHGSLSDEAGGAMASDASVLYS